MFGKLTEIPADEAIACVYHVTRALRHHPKDPELFLSSESSVSDLSLALEVVREIERQERAPLRELSRAASDKYTTKLTAIVLKRMKRELPYDNGAGKRLLKELRDTDERSSTQVPTRNDSSNAQKPDAAQRVPLKRIELSLAPDIYQAFGQIARDQGITIAQAIAKAAVARSKGQSRQVPDQSVQQPSKAPRRNRAR